jgi:hypothetical protein
MSAVAGLSIARSAIANRRESDGRRERRRDLAEPSSVGGEDGQTMVRGYGLRNVQPLASAGVPSVQVLL